MKKILYHTKIKATPNNKNEYKINTIIYSPKNKDKNKKNQYRAKYISVVKSIDEIYIISQGYYE